jgi:hypothetical protein
VAYEHFKARPDLAHPPTGLGHRTPDLGVAPFPRCLETTLAVNEAPQSLSLSLFRRALALVRSPLALVCRDLAIVGKAIPFIGNPVSFVRDPRAPRLVEFTPVKGVLAFIQSGGAAVEFIPGVGMFLTGH